MRRRLLRAILCFGLAIGAGAWPGRAAEPVAGGRFDKAVAGFAAADLKHPPPRAAILFVGSSTFTQWKSLAQDFAPLPVINRAFGGSTYADLLHYLDRVVVPYAPRVVVVYAGDNDLAKPGTAAETVARQVAEFALRVRQALPACRVLFVSIKPSPSRWARWPEMSKANGLIREYAAAHDGLGYIDTTGTLLGADGTPDSTLFLADRLHLNRQGYERWIAVMRPALDKAFQEAH